MSRIHTFYGTINPENYTVGYYAYKINSILFNEMPYDIIEHAMGEDYEGKINIWWLQLINDDKATSLITNFFERIFNDSS